MNRQLGAILLICLGIYLWYLLSDKRKFSELSPLSKNVKINIFVMMFFMLIIAILMVIGKAEIL
ncbi:MAG: hypothetical protein IT258_10420 [Saprospiraceae bacterium]|nr:hypothetical protein [Saprospiraceae bacterium]